VPDASLHPDTDRLVALAERYVWWSPSERTVAHNLPRLVAQVMELGTWEDAHALLRIVGREAFVAVLRSPPVGTFSPPSWTFWHRRLGLGEPPPLPAGRSLPDAAHGPRG
jgi:hypothetical protein